jgi:hypothetical protein
MKLTSPSKEHNMSDDDNNKNGILNKLESVAKIIASVVIASASLIFTHLYNERSLEQERILAEDQNRTSRIAVVREFIPHLISNNETEKKAALIILDSLGQSEFVARFASVDGSEGSKAAGDIIMARSATAAQAPPAEKSVNSEKISGWVYLGHYQSNARTWKTQYFDFSENANPDTLDGQEFKVREATGSINLRNSPPNTFGSLGNVIGSLRPGHEVKVLEVKEWFNSGYIWAKVTG